MFYKSIRLRWLPLAPHTPVAFLLAVLIPQDSAPSTVADVNGRGKDATTKAPRTPVLSTPTSTRTRLWLQSYALVSRLECAIGRCRGKSAVLRRCYRDFRLRVARASEIRKHGRQSEKPFDFQDCRAVTSGRGPSSLRPFGSVPGKVLRNVSESPSDSGEVAECCTHLPVQGAGKRASDSP